MPIFWSSICLIVCNILAFLPLKSLLKEKAVEDGAWEEITLAGPPAPPDAKLLLRLLASHLLFIFYFYSCDCWRSELVIVDLWSSCLVCCRRLFCQIMEDVSVTCEW